MDARAFYDPSHHRSLFGETEGRPNPHRGLDIGGVIGEQIPSWCAGTVVVSEFQSGLGWVVTVQLVGKNGYAGHSHLKFKGLPVGTQVFVNTYLGTVGDTGSLSQGDHDHVTWSASSPYPWTGEVSDPWPLIHRALYASPAGIPGTVPPPNEDGADMILANSPLGFYSLWTSEGFYVVGNQEAADKVYRCMHNGGSISDINFFNSILAGPRWSWDAKLGALQPNLPSVLAGDLNPGGGTAPGGITEAQIAALAKQVVEKTEEYLKDLPDAVVDEFADRADGVNDGK